MLAAVRIVVADGRDQVGDGLGAADVLEGDDRDVADIRVGVAQEDGDRADRPEGADLAEPARGLHAEPGARGKEGLGEGGPVAEVAAGVRVEASAEIIGRGAG